MYARNANIREVQELCLYCSAMNGQPGLRERKKQRTRDTIARAAKELFVERGYDATTLPEIAEAADVSTRTIFAYFPSKEDILFSDFAQMKDGLARALAERPEGKDALETVRDFILASQVAKRSKLDSQLHLCVTSDPTLRSHLRARIAQLEELIAPAIADDLGAREDDARPQVVAASLTAAFTLLAERGVSKAKPWTPEEVGAEIDPVFAFLRGGLDALKTPSERTRRRPARARP
jgi:AcrR family transcriptional regulator